MLHYYIILYYIILYYIILYCENVKLKSSKSVKKV